MSGIERIAAERRRQVEAERYTAEHDDRHDAGQLVRAATCYLDVAEAALVRDDVATYYSNPWSRWPWFDRESHAQGWKPSNEAIRNLEKAGALIAAEIDRLERAQEAAGETGG